MSLGYEETDMGLILKKNYTLKKQVPLQENVTYIEYPGGEGIVQ